MTTSGDWPTEVVEEENENSFDDEAEMSDGEEYEQSSTAVGSRAIQIKQLKAQVKKLQNEHKRKADEVSMLLDAQTVYKYWDKGRTKLGPSKRPQTITSVVGAQKRERSKMHEMVPPP